MTTTQDSVTTSHSESRQPQLALVLDMPQHASHWQLDDETREIGRQGLAKARAALQAARPAHLDLAA